MPLRILSDDRETHKYAWRTYGGEVKRLITFIILLIILNLCAHFLPFERKSLAPDSYSAIVSLKDHPPAGSLLHYLLSDPKRPVTNFLVNLMSKLTGDNPIPALWLVFLTSTGVLIAAYFLFKLLLADDFMAFIAAIIFCLLPNKLESFHNSIAFNINAAFIIYILALIFFIEWIKKNKTVLLWASFTCYTIGIFWYEVGFFMPVIILIYVLLFGKKNQLKSALYFFIPAVAYFLLRATSMFGLVRTGNFIDAIGLSGVFSVIVELLNHYIGRYMIRSIIYGVYKFITLPKIWLACFFLIDLIILLFLAALIKKYELKKLSRALFIFSGGLFVFYFLPLFLNIRGAVGGRHLVLPSLGLALFFLGILELVKKHWRASFLVFVGVTLIICQGNSWCQVVACRINAAVYDTIKEKKSQILKAQNIIIDTNSFAENIPFTFVRKDFNVLNTYYGAQTFETWGLCAMARLAIDDNGKNCYIATERPVIAKDGNVEFQVSEPAGYRIISKQKKYLSQANTVIIDFESAYGSDFNNGLRK